MPTIRSALQGRSRESGAALIEFALIAPVLFIILFGIIEAGWAFNQQLEVRHGAREGARLVAVDFGTDTEVTAAVCERMHFSGDETTTSVKIGTPTNTQFTNSTDVGDVARIAISADYNSLTGFLDGIFGGATLGSEVEIRLEQDPQNGLGTNSLTACP